MSHLCKTCHKPLQGFFEISNKQCEQCFALEYERSAKADALTDKELPNERN